MTLSKKHVLFLCSLNRFRSPTAEKVFMTWPGIEVASAGLNAGANGLVTAELLGWSDIIFVMERVHRTKLATSFQAQLNGKRIICLNIPDKYSYMDPSLVAILRERVSKFLRAA